MPTLKRQLIARTNRSPIALFWNCHETVFIILETCISPSRVLIDVYLPNFQTIVEQSSVALDAYTQPNGTQPAFTIGISVGLTIWYTCLRCHEAGIRRMALDLLRRAPQVQGVYKFTSFGNLWRKGHYVRRDVWISNK